MLKKLYLAFIFFTYIVFLVKAQDECSGKTITVNGYQSSMTNSIFASISNQYTMERQKYNRNVTINATLVEISALKYGLTISPSLSNPLVFNTVTKNVLYDKNEMRFPLAASALVVIYNLPGYNRLTLSLPNIVSIYKGSTEYWNYTYIAKNNPNVTMPDEPILPLARIDSDPSTGLFTQVLSANNAEWKEKYGLIYDPTFVNGTSTKWPQGAIHMFVNMTVGMVGVVASIPNTIGYVTLPSIAEYGNIPQVRIIMSGSQPIEVAPTEKAIQAAMKYFMNNSDTNELLLNLGLANDTDAYPMSAFTYFALNRSYTNVDCCTVQELVGFIDWYLFNWGDDNLRKLKFIPLLPELKARIKRVALSEITCNGELMYPKYLHSKRVIPVTVTEELEPWIVAVISILSCLSLAFVGCCAFYYMYLRKVASDESQWLIDGSRLKQTQSKKEKQVEFEMSSKKDAMSVQSGTMSDASKSICTTRGNYTGKGMATSLKEKMCVAELDRIKVFVDKMECRFAQHWPKQTKRLMTKMKNLSHKNVANLLGVSTMDNQPVVIFEYATKGTLHYVLRTTKYSITNEMKFQFAIDVANGMKYLHQNGIISGKLSSLTCFLDSSWTVKIGEWQQMMLYALENPKMLHEFGSYNSDNHLEEADLVTLLYVDPSLRRAFNESVDVYSFGVMLVEIFTRALPYNKEIEDGTMSYSEILLKKFNRNYNMCPKLDKLPRKVGSLTFNCMSIENHRPSFASIVSEMKSMTKVSTGIVDIVMDALEKHAEELEEKVEERTAELKQMTDKMRVLLHEVLPPQIAEKLFNGEPVPPEYYECVTVYFSDIVGFTNISARSSPIDVMALLNDLWVAFDAIIDKFDVYKVDTIGDAYMVCSGLPIRNGMNHCKQIALLSLALLDKCSRFKIKHLPDDVLKIRIGINSGPVTAGVVGLKMPQYCVFGDTVNTAARMESTSEAQRIQISSCTHTFIKENFPDMFETEYRGEITVKGKGSMETYWLKNEKKKMK